MDKFHKLKEVLADKLELVTFDKKTVLVHQGEVSRFVYIVKKGCLRLWYNHDGEDITVQFFKPGSAVGPFECIFWEQAAEMNVETVIASEVLKVKREDVVNLIYDTPELYKFIFNTLLQRLSDYQHMFLDTIKYNPQQRYENLIAKDPELFELVPQHYIASYLGITAVSLSRIRNKLASH